MTDISRKMEILLVEDSETDVLIAREVARDSMPEANLHVVGDGESALSFLKQETPFEAVPRPDLVLLDWNLPGMSGAEVLLEMKKTSGLLRIPVVVLTTSGVDQDVTAAYEMHANSYIRKPLSVNALRQTFSSIQQYWLRMVSLPNQPYPRTIRTLLVEDNPTDVLLMREALQRSKDATFTTTSAESLAECEKRLEEGGFDIIVADLNLGDSTGLATFLALRDQAPNIPIIIFTGLNDDTTKTQTVQFGASDYQVKGELAPGGLGRLIREAVERHDFHRLLSERKEHERHEREVDSVMRSSAAASAQDLTIPTATLRDSKPAEFRAQVEKYRLILKKAVGCRIYKNQQDPEESLLAMGSDLGRLGAGPRDVIEIHSACLQEIANGLEQGKTQIYFEEARIAVLQIMGQLASFYRNLQGTKKREAAAP